MFHYLCFLTFFANSSRYANLGLFWPNFRMQSERGIRNGSWYHNLKYWSQKWITNLEKTSQFDHSFYDSCNIVYKFGLFLVQFWLDDIRRIVKFPNFEKMTEDQIFDLKKFGGDILLWNCFKKFVKVTPKRGSVSQLLPNILEKF